MSAEKKISQYSKVSRNTQKNKGEEQYQTEMLSQSRDVSQISQPIHRPPFIFDASEISSKMKY